MTEVLIVRSNCDAATGGTYAIGAGLMAHLQSKGLSVTELADAAASPANVQYWLNSASCRTTKLVIALDHGSCDAFYGEVSNAVTPVISKANVKDLTSGLHVYTFACSTAGSGCVGDSAIAQGTRSWLGYTEPVYVFTDPASTLFQTLKTVIWSYITALATGASLETAEKALRDAYQAHQADNPVFGYNLQRLRLVKQQTGMSIFSHNRVGASLVGIWAGSVDWGPTGSKVAAGPWTFNADGTWTYAYGGGRWIQVDDKVMWTFNNAPGLVYSGTVTAGALNGIMGYTTAPPNPGRGRFSGTRTIVGLEAAAGADPMRGPVSPEFTAIGTPEVISLTELGRVAEKVPVSDGESARVPSAP